MREECRLGVSELVSECSVAICIISGSLLKSLGGCAGKSLICEKLMTQNRLIKMA